MTSSRPSRSTTSSSGPSPSWREWHPTRSNFDAKVTVLMENVRHHVKEEEKSLFPQVRKAMGRQKLNELGQSLADAKRTAPTRPAPHVQSEPVAGAA